MLATLQLNSNTHGVSFFQIYRSSTCGSLLSGAWRSYANDLDNAPHAEGIYTIGVMQSGNVRYIYVGYSIDMRRRLQQHKSQTLAIDTFLKEQFSSNGGKNLRFKWVKVTNAKCAEGNYLECMQEKLGYWPEYNKKRGNKCK